MSNTINWDNFKVRCSAINKVLSNSQSNPVLTEIQAVRLKELADKEDITEKQKEELAGLRVKEQNGTKIILSDGCIEYLMEVYAWETQGMIPVNKESLDLLQIRKGKEGEFEAVELLSRVDGIMYQIHKERIFNDYLSGEIDIYTGTEIMQAEIIGDIKNAFDYPTFLKKTVKGLELPQKQQVQGYCDITSAKSGFIANTLVSCSEEVINEMQFKVAKKFNAFSTESPEFLIEWERWERSMRFDHILPSQRVHKIPVEVFTKFEQQKLYDRVKICRDWLSLFHEQYLKMNL